MTDAIVNSAKNTVLPFASGSDVAIGSVEYVTVEVIVDMVLRAILRGPRRGVVDLAIIHTLSLPILGGIQAVYGKAPIDYGSGSMLDHVKDGAAGVPAVFIAQWIYGARNGLRIPRGFNLYDIMITIIAKTATKPLLAAVWPFLPKKMVQDALRATNSMFRAEVRNSNIAMGDTR